MDAINNRFRQLREVSKKSQEDWGKILGISRSGVSEIESGRRKVTDKHLLMLGNWKDHFVNIDWLRTGEGSIFLELPEDDEIAALVYELLGKKNDAFYNIVLEIIKSYKKLSPISQKALNELADDVIRSLKEKSVD